MFSALSNRLPLAAVAIAVSALVLHDHAAHAAAIPLSSTMDPATGMSDNALTGGQARIGLGTGAPGDADGLYDINDSGIPFGSGFDLFPNEGAFGVGSLTFNEALVTGSGVEVVAIDSLDLSSLWASGSSTTDISDAALGDWFFGLTRSFTFGPLDASDTLTFTNGLLTSVDLSIAATYSMVDGGSNLVEWDGTLSIAGSTIDLAIAEAEDFDTGFGILPTTIASDLSGTVDAVGSYVVPEPGTGLLLASGLAVLAAGRRRKV